MVNTVGSLQSKYWNKKMLFLKKEMRLTPKQRSFIIGSMLGDATMRVGIKAKNANFKIDHCLEQTEIYDQFYTTDSYRCGRKIVPNLLVDSMNAFVIAVWVMDDGSYNHGKIDISTYSFTLKEIEKLCSIIKKKFNITMLYHKDRDKGYRIYCNKKETQKLVDLICPYIIKTMRYKIGLS